MTDKTKLFCKKPLLKNADVTYGYIVKIIIIFQILSLLKYRNLPLFSILGALGVIGLIYLIQSLRSYLK